MNLVSRRTAVMVAVAMLMTLAPEVASAHHTNFQGDCHNARYSITYRSRSGARNIANVARYEGYQWGGGCHNTNDIDDSPGDPVENSGTKGEGTDCSGLIFKSWAMSETFGSTARYYFYYMTNVHGPYNSTSFRDGSGGALTSIGKSYGATEDGDALAQSGHVGMIYYEGSSNNTDRIMESKSEAAGTGLWTRSYRGSSSYKAVKHSSW